MQIDLQQQLLELLEMQTQKVNEFALLRNDSYAKLAELLQEIAVNQDVPKNVFELAKAFVSADGVEQAFYDDLVKLNQKIAELREQRDS